MIWLAAAVSFFYWCLLVRLWYTTRNIRELTWDRDHGSNEPTGRMQIHDRGSQGE